MLITVLSVSSVNVPVAAQYEDISCPKLTKARIEVISGGGFTKDMKRCCNKSSVLRQQERNDAQAQEPFEEP